jgi:hypothetical protein
VHTSELGVEFLQPFAQFRQEGLPTFFVVFKGHPEAFDRFLVLAFAFSSFKKAVLPAHAHFTPFGWKKAE